MINFKVGESAYDYDDTTMTVAEARLIKKHSGFGLKSWAMGLQDMDPDALVGLVFLAKRRAGEAIRWQDLDNLDIAAIALSAGDAEEEEVDPPAPAPTTRSNAGRTRK